MRIKTRCEDCQKIKDCYVFDYNGRLRSQCMDCRKKEKLILGINAPIIGEEKR